MKDSMFEMLLNLFEMGLAELQKSHKKNASEASDEATDELFENDAQSLFIRTKDITSTRVYTLIEQIKLSKASQQFLMKMKLLHVIDEIQFEAVVHQLLFSESRIVGLEETKWTIRNTLELELTPQQVVFLDLLLNQNEESYTIQ